MNLSELQASADRGDARAQFNLGVMYGKGEAVAQDDVEAVKWFRKAADQGIARAQYNLGYRYRDGKGVAQDDAEAVKWYRKAADQGHPGAQASLHRLAAASLARVHRFATAH